MKLKTKFLGLAVLAGVMAFASFTSSTTFAGSACLGGGTGCNTPTTVTVSVLPGDVCLGSTGAFNFGSYTVKSVLQTVTGAFVGTGGYFWVDDLKGANSGYYTTVMVSNLVGPAGATISSGNVYMKAPASVTLMAGTTNPLVLVNATIAGAFQPLNVANTLIYRNSGANSGVVGMYGVLPQMSLDIPAYQAVGTYTGTLTYTLIENA